MTQIYLRKERRLVDGIMQSVVAYYRDAEMNVFLCYNPWSDRPTRRNKYVMYNCNKYRAVWLEVQKRD